MKDVTIVIPTWNGKEILEKSLPVIIKNAPDCPIIVVDDHSEDDTVDYLKKFPKIKVLTNQTNQGFTKSVNKGLGAVETEFVCLLNNDVYPQKGFLDKSQGIIKKDSQVAAVTFNEENSSWPLVKWSGGKLSFEQGHKDGRDHYCMWPSGGSCLIRTAVFKSLGGFREVFSPGYFEDIELGFRIWRSGMRIVWSSEAKVIHRHETSFKKLNPKFISDLKQSNELVFTWLTFFEKPYIFDHIFFLISYTLTHIGYARIILLAVLKFMGVNRQRNPQEVEISQILQMANQRYG